MLVSLCTIDTWMESYFKNSFIKEMRIMRQVMAAYAPLPDFPFYGASIGCFAVDYEGLKFWGDSLEIDLGTRILWRWEGPEPSELEGMARLASCSSLNFSSCQLVGVVGGWAVSWGLCHFLLLLWGPLEGAVSHLAVHPLLWDGKMVETSQGKLYQPSQLQALILSHLSLTHHRCHLPRSRRENEISVNKFPSDWVNP